MVSEGGGSRERADGHAIEAEADRHPDPTAEAIRWQICEGELLQIIGRPRGVNRTVADPVDVLVLCDVPLPLPIDDTLSVADLAPSPTELMLAAGGIAFENSADAAAAYPKLWTPDAARQAALPEVRDKSECRVFLFGSVTHLGPGGLHPVPGRLSDGRQRPAPGGGLD